MTAGSVALLLLFLPVNTVGLRLNARPGSQHVGESLAQLAADTAETDSDSAVVGPANVDVADIVRHDFKNWYIVKDGRTVNQNIEGKYVSAKPRNILWDRIGSWDYSRSSTKTNPLVKVKLDGSRGALVKLELALRFMYGGRVGVWPAHPELRNKGRFLKKIRVIPHTYVSNGYSLNARVSEITVRRTGTRTDPIAEAKLKIRIQYGKKGVAFATWHKSVWEITVKGTGHHSARKLSSSRANAAASEDLESLVETRSLMQTESISTDSDEESAEEFDEQEGYEREEQMDDEELVSTESEEAFAEESREYEKSLVQVSGKATEAASDRAISGPPNVDIADIRRYGYKSWYIVKDGRGVQENMENKSVSAKPRGIIWDRIGTWNYTLSAKKTNPLITVKLDGSVGTLVKIDLALRFVFGGRVQQWTAHPELFKKGRFLRKIRVIPMTYCSNSSHGGYSANAQVSEVTVRRNGTRGDPVAEATLKIKIEYGQKRLSRAFWYQSEWKITVQGTGHYTARKLSSKGPFRDAEAGSLMQTESISTDSEEESAEEVGEQDGDESEEQMDNEELVSMESEESSAEESREQDGDESAE